MVIGHEFDDYPSKRVLHLLDYEIINLLNGNLVDLFNHSRFLVEIVVLIILHLAPERLGLIYEVQIHLHILFDQGLFDIVDF